MSTMSQCVDWFIAVCKPITLDLTTAAATAAAAAVTVTAAISSTAAASSLLLHLHLLLQCSRLDLWGSPVFCDAIYLCDIFPPSPSVTPTTELTSHIVWPWMVHAGMFKLLAFARLCHVRQNLLRLCSGMHACKEQVSVCTLIQKS